MILSPVQLLRLAPRCPDTISWAAALNEAMREFGIESKLQVAHWLAQLAHESAEFTRLVESLTYTSAERILAVWPTRFWLPSPQQPTCPAGRRDAHGFVRAPVLLASYVYAGRNGNGSEATSDGFRFRGRGPIQITGRANYARCGQALALPLIEQPDLLTDPDVGARAAAWYWADRKIGPLADANDIEAVTRRINGGTHGLDGRRRYLQTAMRVLA
ncbi:MAG: glycoside hydrolase family 19 protein [Gammaproteobacteria bacterium]|nr:glycoside hydrolase family 19 protein [Gammaproteobacteria bacterium]MBU0771809.1 glycoside hydrolase family 19 protein [Gammaproteobacteria bacterium]MBU0855565.1 glycoside hydrolase family 19 protein [Gammaproteobacteria bacterium]MBU1846127.1 glycoside hydrolase family 19 protein [Gammaproteobacteria bacterium]